MRQHLAAALLATTAHALAPITRRHAAAAATATVVAAPPRARAADGVYTSNDGTYSFATPEGFEPKPKPVRTHADEVLYKDANRREIGVVVDRVTIAALGDFGTPAFVGEKVVASERNRDGVTDAFLKNSRAVEKAGRTYYELAYGNASSRGDFRFLSRVAVADGRLYVMTLKARADDAAAEGVLAAVAESFRVGS